MNAITEYREESYTADAEGCWPLEARGKPLPGILWVLYVNGVPVMSEHVCPCGCGAKIPTFLQSEPKWKFSPKDGLWSFNKGPNGPTLSPSIRILGGCKSHYNITDGKVIMHGDSGR